MSLQTAWTPYCGAAPTPAELLSRWNLDPILLAALLLFAIVYWRVAAKAQAHHWPGFAAAALLALILFVSPFCALTSALFSARVVHHVALAAFLAPLLVWSLPRGALGPSGSLWLWTAAQALVFWAWHAPVLYAAALANDAAYWLMQLSILGAAIGFWHAVRHSSALASAAALLATVVHMGLLGALITFAASALYAPHWQTTAAWGLAPLEDQQLAGLIMWAPAAGFYLGAALFLIGRWLGRDTRAVAA